MNNELKSKLLNCPFCGKMSFVVRECDDEEEYVMYSVMCNSQKCGTQSGKFYTRQDAIAAWNQRA
jgi:Lar family restriction alleviation protein